MTSGGTALSPLDARPVHRRAASFWALASAGALHTLGAVLLVSLGHKVLHRATAPLVSEWVEVDLPAPTPAPPMAKPEPPSPSAIHAVPRPAPAPIQAPEPADPEPPAAAEAGQVLTAAGDIVDFGDTIVTGQGAYAGGTTERGGGSKVAVLDAGARASGSPQASGSIRGAASPNRSTAPALAGGANWNCPFPREANDDAIDSATVGLKVQVGPDGKVLSADIVRDPGSGFGREARRCALQKRWQPGTDEHGAPKAMSAHVQVRFER